MRNFNLALVLLLSTALHALGGTAVPNHSEWTSLLQRHVSISGAVDYSAFKSDAQFDAYLLILEGSHPDESWSRNQRMAYWINAYNAFTIKLINENMPIKSIKDIKDPWDQQFISIEGKRYSLNHIEHEILRPVFGDARIHFAVNCASKSCPPLMNKAYTASSLDSQLEKVTRAFINDARYNTISSDQVRVSPIFDWFSSDFEAKGSVREFINRYSTRPISRDTMIKYTEYDWSLNN
jgi:hypothetical protein